MILYHNIDEDFKQHKVVVSKLSLGIAKIKELYEEYSLKPLLFYGHINYPPLYYNFIDEENDFTPCFAYLIPDENELIGGNKLYQINSENYKYKSPNIDVETYSEGENFILYLKSGDEIKIYDDFKSRLEAICKLMKILKKKIVEEGKVLQYFYHAFHSPPCAFMLLSAEGRPTGVFAFIRREKDTTFNDPIYEMTQVRPNLAIYTTKGEL